MDLLFFAIGLGLYVIATAAFVIHLMVAHETPRRVALITLTLAFVTDTAALALRTGTAGSITVNSFHDRLSILAWLIVGLYLLLQLRYHLVVLGALVTPLAFLLTLSAYLVYSGVETLPPQLQNAWLPAHVAPAFLGYAVFTLASCVSLMYLLQERQLKGKRRGGMFLRWLPSLETLDNLNFRFVGWGFALFTLGIVTGSILAKAVWGTFWLWEPVQVLSVIAWLLYALLLQMRSIGWRGRKAARLTIVGFALLIVSFLSFNLGFPGPHGSSFG